MSLSRASAIVGCLLGGHAVAATLCWSLVNVPESNVAMLALSVAVTGALILVLSWTERTALLAWESTVPFRRAAQRGVAGVTTFVAAALVFGLLWWLTARAEAWHAAHAGEIDAWWIAQTGSAKTGWIGAGATILLWLVRYLVGVSLAVAALSAGTILGGRAILSPGWVGRGLSLRQIGPTGLAMVVFVLLPLQAVHWRPALIPPTWVEAAFVAVRLGTIYLAVNVGWALVLRAGARAISAPSPPPS
jgi:hypothetical protein